MEVADSSIYEWEFVTLSCWRKHVAGTNIWELQGVDLRFLAAAEGRHRLPSGHQDHRDVRAEQSVHTESTLVLGFQGKP